MPSLKSTINNVKSSNLNDAVNKEKDKLESESSKTLLNEIEGVLNSTNVNDTKSLKHLSDSLTDISQYIESNTKINESERKVLDQIVKEQKQIIQNETSLSTRLGKTVQEKGQSIAQRGFDFQASTLGVMAGSPMLAMLLGGAQKLTEKSIGGVSNIIERRKQDKAERDERATRLGQENNNTDNDITNNIRTLVPVNNEIPTRLGQENDVTDNTRTLVPANNKKPTENPNPLVPSDVSNAKVSIESKMENKRSATRIYKVLKHIDGDLHKLIKLKNIQGKGKSLGGLGSMIKDVVDSAKDMLLGALQMFGIGIGGLLTALGLKKGIGLLANRKKQPPKVKPVNDKDKKLRLTNDKDKKVKPVNDKDKKVKPVNDKDKKLRLTNDKDKKLRLTNDKDKKLRLTNDKDKKVKPVNDKDKKLRLTNDKNNRVRQYWDNEIIKIEDNNKKNIKITDDPQKRLTNKSSTELNSKVNKYYAQRIKDIENNNSINEKNKTKLIQLEKNKQSNDFGRDQRVDLKSDFNQSSDAKVISKPTTQLEQKPKLSDVGKTLNAKPDVNDNTLTNSVKKPTSNIRKAVGVGTGLIALSQAPQIIEQIGNDIEQGHEVAAGMEGVSLALSAIPHVGAQLVSAITGTLAGYARSEDPIKEIQKDVDVAVTYITETPAGEIIGDGIEFATNAVKDTVTGVVEMIHHPLTFLGKLGSSLSGIFSAFTGGGNNDEKVKTVNQGPTFSSSTFERQQEEEEKERLKQEAFQAAEEEKSRIIQEEKAKEHRLRQEQNRIRQAELDQANIAVERNMLEGEAYAELLQQGKTASQAEIEAKLEMAEHYATISEIEKEKILAEIDILDQKKVEAAIGARKIKSMINYNMDLNAPSTEDTNRISGALNREPGQEPVQSLQSSMMGDVMTGAKNMLNSASSYFQEDPDEDDFGPRDTSYDSSDIWNNYDTSPNMDNGFSDNAFSDNAYIDEAAINGANDGLYELAPASDGVSSMFEELGDEVISLSENLSKFGSELFEQTNNLSITPGGGFSPLSQTQRREINDDIINNKTSTSDIKVQKASTPASTPASTAASTAASTPASIINSILSQEQEEQEEEQDSEDVGPSDTDVDEYWKLQDEIDQDKIRQEKEDLDRIAQERIEIENAKRIKIAADEALAEQEQKRALAAWLYQDEENTRIQAEEDEKERVDQENIRKAEEESEREQERIELERIQREQQEEFDREEAEDAAELARILKAEDDAQAAKQKAVVEERAREKEKERLESIADDERRESARIKYNEAAVARWKAEAAEEAKRNDWVKIQEAEQKQQREKTFTSVNFAQQALDKMAAMDSSSSSSWNNNSSYNNQQTSSNITNNYNNEAQSGYPSYMFANQDDD
jgi:hypothetical protein